MDNGRMVKCMGMEFSFGKFLRMANTKRKSTMDSTLKGKSKERGRFTLYRETITKGIGRMESNMAKACFTIQKISLLNKEIGKTGTL
jgi:hypothetical protein